MKNPINVLKEAVLSDEKRFPEGWEGYLEKVKESTFIQRVLREGLFKDVAGALGGIHERVIEAAKPALIGRDMVWVVPTKEAKVRFFKEKPAKAFVVGETAPPELPQTMETTDISPDIEIACKMEFSRSYIEDAPWAVLARAAEEGGRAVAQLETGKIIALYNGIAGADLATGGTQATNEGASFVWADIAKLWAAVKQENFEPKILAIHPRESEGLVQANQFIQSLYYAPEETIRRGVFELPYLGMRVLVSSLIPAVDATHNTKFCIDTDWAAALLLRRDITTEPFEDPGNLSSGLIVSERIGLGVLRSKAVAKGV